MKITIAGAGIAGLSTAYLLNESGHDIKIIASSFSPNLTSNKAAAFWFPYHIRNDKRGIEWCRESLEKYIAFAKDITTGVSVTNIIKAIATDTQNEDTSWLEFMPANTCEEVDKRDLRNGFRKAYKASIPLIETQIFLPWLMKELENSGVIFETQKIESLEQPNEGILINCTGLGSRKLCNDDELIPVRGQVLLLSPKKMDHIFLDNERPSYMVPRHDAIIVGGSYEEGVYEEETDDTTLQLIKENIYRIYPELTNQEVIGSWAGLRPYRSEIRLEREGNIIHNYGHGGSGYTLAWGCATSVKKMINEL